MGVIPTLVKLLGVHSHNASLTEMCLIAFGNLAELGESEQTSHCHYGNDSAASSTGEWDYRNDSQVAVVSFQERFLKVC